MEITEKIERFLNEAMKPAPELYDDFIKDLKNKSKKYMQDLKKELTSTIKELDTKYDVIKILKIELKEENNLYYLNIKTEEGPDYNCIHRNIDERYAIMLSGLSSIEEYKVTVSSVKELFDSASPLEMSGTFYNIKDIGPNFKKKVIKNPSKASNALDPFFKSLLKTNVSNFTRILKMAKRYGSFKTNCRPMNF